MEKLGIFAFALGISIHLLFSTVNSDLTTTFSNDSTNILLEQTENKSHMPRNDSEFSLGLTNSKSMDDMLRELGPLCIGVKIPSGDIFLKYGFVVLSASGLMYEIFVNKVELLRENHLIVSQ